MTAMGFVAVAAGAVLGAWLRWVLGLGLNALYPHLPPGTLAANLIGGYVIGAAMGYFAQAPGMAPEWRLFIITGFCGGLTTFSTFSAEIATLFQAGKMAAFTTAIVTHVGGSLAMTLLGLASVRWITR